MHPNVELARRGLITLDNSGRMTDYVAIVKSAGASAQVYVKREADIERVGQLLEEMRAEGLYGFSRVYTAQEAWEEERLSGGFAFVLETDGYTSFGNDYTGALCRPHDISDYRFGRATHGHQPDKGPQPTFIAFGPDIRPGALLERRPIVDEPATFARVLGVDMGEIDGRPMVELLRDGI